MRRLLSILFLFCLLLGGVTRVDAARIVYSFAGGTEKPRVALTFDDGPHPVYTPQILDILKEFGVSATFFVVGSNAEQYPHLLQRILEEGHELGNHTYNHRRVAKLKKEELIADISSCQSVLERYTHTNAHLFRPPEGVCSEDVKDYCEKAGLTIVMWSVDTRDWAHTPIDVICENVKHNTRDGSIILMHDFIGKNSPTPAALRRIIPMLGELGFELVNISQLLGEAE